MFWKSSICAALLVSIAAPALANQEIYLVRQSEDAAPGVPERTLRAAGYDLKDLSGTPKEGFAIRYSPTMMAGKKNPNLTTFVAMTETGYVCIINDQTIPIAAYTALSASTNTMTSFSFGKETEARVAREATEDSIAYLKTQDARNVRDQCAYLHAHLKP